MRQLLWAEVQQFDQLQGLCFRIPHGANFDNAYPGRVEFALVAAALVKRARLVGYNNVIVKVEGDTDPLARI